MSDDINIKNEKKTFLDMENILCAKHNEIENDGIRGSSSCYYLRTRRRQLGEAKELRGGFNAHRSKSYIHRGCRGRYTTHLYNNT